MGLIDLKAKADAFDKAQEQARTADLHNAQVAAFTKGRSDGELVGMQKAYEGLASRFQGNPQGYANVPGQEMGAGYTMPAAGATNTQMYQRPAQQAPVGQGLAAKIMNMIGAR